MSKIVRLTESDLIRLVKKVMNEQDNLNKRPYDKMVMDCLKKDGFKVYTQVSKNSDANQGLYAFSMEKDVNIDGSNVKLSVTTGNNPAFFVVRKFVKQKDGTMKIFRGEITLNRNSNCDEIVKFANNPTKQI